MNRSPVVLLPRRIGVSRLPSPCPTPAPGTSRSASARLVIAWSRIASSVTTDTACGTSFSAVLVFVAVRIRRAA